MRTVLSSCAINPAHDTDQETAEELLGFRPYAKPLKSGLDAYELDRVDGLSVFDVISRDMARKAR